MISRRRFLGASLLALLGPALRLARAGDAPAAPALPSELRGALEASPFVYVSPLRADGSESTCHGEVWFAWLDGAVVLTTGSDTWKARSLARGLDRARLWVGDHGRWNRLVGTNESFRRAPHFDARAERLQDAALLDRLLRVYARKYPDEIARWEPRMRAGHADGSRVLVRYRPLADPSGRAGGPPALT